MCPPSVPPARLIVYVSVVKVTNETRYDTNELQKICRRAKQNICKEEGPGPWHHLRLIFVPGRLYWGWQSINRFSLGGGAVRIALPKAATRGDVFAAVVSASLYMVYRRSSAAGKGARIIHQLYGTIDDLDSPLMFEPIPLPLPRVRRNEAAARAAHSKAEEKIAQLEKQLIRAKKHLKKTAAKVRYYDRRREQLRKATDTTKMPSSTFREKMRRLREQQEDHPSDSG